MKTTWVIVAVGLTFFAFLYIGVAWYYKVPVLSLLFFAFQAPAGQSPPPSPSITPVGFAAIQEPSAKVLSATKTKLPDHSLLYTLYGKFVTPLLSEGSDIRGKFVVDDDPAATPISAKIIPVEGKFRLGISKGTIRGKTQWNDKTKEDVLALVQPGVSAQISWTVSASSSAQERQFAIVLDETIQGNWHIPEGTNISVLSVGVLGQ